MFTQDNDDIQRQRWRERRPISGFVTHVVMLFFASGRDISPVRVIVVAESSTIYAHTGLNLVRNKWDLVD